MKRKFIKKFAQEKKSKELWEQVLTKTITAIQATVKRRGEYRATKASVKKPKVKSKSFWGTVAGRLKRYSPWRKTVERAVKKDVDG